jgi:HEAT repeat protein
MMYDAQVKTRLQDLEHFTAADIDAAIKRNDLDELLLVSVTVALVHPDQLAAQDVCLRLSLHAHNKVRGNAVMSFGHLARRFRALDEQTVKPIIEAALNDEDDYVRTHAKSAADEIHQFLGWNIAGHEFGA